jgi:hypothetical protein
MQGTQLSLSLDTPPLSHFETRPKPFSSADLFARDAGLPAEAIASGEKAKARDILAAIRT